MKRAWLTAALAPLSFAAMVHAQTTVSGARTEALSTSSAGNVTVNSGGSVKPSAGPAAVTVNSSNTVSNDGTVGYSGVSDAAGVLVDTAGGAISSTITNTGTISLSETTTGDSTNQSITTGPYANGSNRVGIKVSGAGAFTGSIINSGAITIVGENSAGIEIGSNMVGDLLQSGTISVTGGSTATTGGESGNVSYGINATGSIDGNVTIGGSIAARGQNATGVALSGGVSGGVEVDGNVTATGYRSATAPTDPKVLAKLNGDQILQGGPAMAIGGNVGGGITIDAAVSASGNTSAVTEGVLTVYGSAPALLIGGNSAITIGANADGYSLEVGGAINGIGEYPDVGATAIQIGGSNPLAVDSSGVGADGQFGNVTLTDGLDVSGSVLAEAEYHTAGSGDTAAILIGSGGNVSSIVNSGTIIGSVTSDAAASSDTSVNDVRVTDGASTVPITVSAIRVEAGGTLTSINNSGTIAAEITGISTATNYTAAGGTEGQAVAIYDASGTLTSVTNTDLISASITPIVTTQSVDSAHSDAVAMYLANVDGNVTVTQSPNGNTSITPTITGAVIFGRTDGSTTGSEILNLDAGNLTGDVAFNGSGANELTIDGGATLTGALSQAAAGSLSLDINNGVLDMTSPTANSYGGSSATIPVGNLTIGAKGEAIFSIDPSATNATAAQFNVSGSADLKDGAKVGVNLLSKLTSTQTFTLIEAGSLTIEGSVGSSLIGQLPYLYQGAITTTSNDLNITISTKTPAQMGFNAAESSAYKAIYQAISQDKSVESMVLGKTSRSSLVSAYDQFLPDYAGGPFEAIAEGQREIARAQADAPAKLQTDGVRGWVQEIAYLANRSGSAAANGYQTKSIGLAAGIEQAQGDSAIGVSGAIISTGVSNAAQVSDASLSTLTIEGGAYWRKGGEGLNANASVNAGYVSLGSHRLLLDQSASGEVSLRRDAEAQWHGAVASVQLGVAYQITRGRFYLRPEASADYIAFYESGYSEHGGGAALNLAVNSRLSTEASAQADVVLGWNLGAANHWRPELTLGWRQVVVGGPASTTARFLSGGSAFTLAPDLSDRGGILARLGIRSTGVYSDFSASAGGEFRDGYQSYHASAVARFLF